MITATEIGGTGIGLVPILFRGLLPVTGEGPVQGLLRVTAGGTFSCLSYLILVCRRLNLYHMLNIYMLDDVHLPLVCHNLFIFYPGKQVDSTWLPQVPLWSPVLPFQVCGFFGTGSFRLHDCICKHVLYRT